MGLILCIIFHQITTMGCDIGEKKKRELSVRCRMMGKDIWTLLWGRKSACLSEKKRFFSLSLHWYRTLFCSLSLSLSWCKILSQYQYIKFIYFFLLAIRSLSVQQCIYYITIFNILHLDMYKRALLTPHKEGIHNNLRI